MKYNVPKEVLSVAMTLEKAGFEAYLVGGCVRDLILGREPKDWDIATNAKPEEIQKLFPDSVYENQFGTVGVKTDSEDPKLKVIEITTFRLEGKYTDKRHPDEIKFAKTIEEDLGRRDFTINAIAAEIRNEKLEIRDPCGGQDDLKNKIIRTVGKPEERFNEDALRLMRAARFATELGWQIDFETRRAIVKLAGLLEMIAKERVRDELVKILETLCAAEGIVLLEELDILRYVIPELREGIGVSQNRHHTYTVFEHNIRALDYTVKQNYALYVRMAALLHDVGKPRTKRGEGSASTFHGHEYVSARMTFKILDRLRFSKEFAERVAHLVRSHMFYYNVGEVTAAGVRRFLARVGVGNVDDIMEVREADRIGSGVPKAVVYKMRHLLFMIEKVRRDPVSPKMLAVDGNDVMEIADIPPGPRVGYILAVLLEEVLDEPKKNTKENLESRIRELGKLAEEELKKLALRAKETKEEFESNIEEEIKKRHHI
jgi:poly(A) polymerase/tRNA nucleotidyltransferase (CCA-adding enzyme)